MKLEGRLFFVGYGIRDAFGVSRDFADVFLERVIFTEWSRKETRTARYASLSSSVFGSVYNVGQSLAWKREDSLAPSQTKLQNNKIPSGEDFVFARNLMPVRLTEDQRLGNIIFLTRGEILHVRNKKIVRGIFLFVECAFENRSSRGVHVNDDVFGKKCCFRSAHGKYRMRDSQGIEERYNSALHPGTPFNFMHSIFVLLLSGKRKKPRREK